MYTSTVAALSSEEPLFYGRIGGSDTDMVIDYLEGVMRGDDEERIFSRLRRHFPIVEAYNGYYDKRGDENNYLRYCKVLLECYLGLRQASIVGGRPLTLYFKNNINPIFWVGDDGQSAVYDFLINQIHDRAGALSLYPFPFIEKTTSHQWSLFNAFREILQQKKVLILTPFSQTIENNFHNRQNFFKNYEYPEFTAIPLTTPITYQGLPSDLYPHSDWFETVDALQADVAKIEFDIALLSCGSYAMPLGDYIVRALGKKAIYVGGILQLYFGIMGRRYENIFFTSQINEEFFVRAEERDLYLRHIEVAPGSATEGFGAYL
jgi:hypothetical protein